MDPSPNVKIMSKKIYLLSSYDFKTLASLDVYTLPSQVFQAYEQQAVNSDISPYSLIFQKEQNSRLNKQVGKITSTYTYGPMKLAIDIVDNQPLTEQGPFDNNPYYTLVVQLAKSSSTFTGKLKELKSLKIKVPENLELAEDSPLTRESTEDGFTSYSLTKSQIDIQNKRFTDPNNLDPKLEIILKLKVSELNKDSLEKTFILAEVNYVYEDKYGTSITIVKPTQETASGTEVIS